MTGWTFDVRPNPEVVRRRRIRECRSDTVLTTIVTRADQLAGADGASIYEFDAVAREFYLRATKNFSDELVEVARTAPLCQGEGLMSVANVVTGDRMSRRSVGTSRSFAPRREEDEHGFESRRLEPASPPYSDFRYSPSSVFSDSDSPSLKN